MECKLNILGAKCKDKDKVCKFYNSHMGECELYDHLKSEWVKTREITSRNFFLSDVVQSSFK